MKGKGKLNSAVGLYSTKSNPMKAPKEVSSANGPSSNSDAQKANRLRSKAYAQIDSLRGKSGM